LTFTLLVSFILVRDYFKTNEYDEIYILWGPVLSAIITVNVIIVAYVYRAYQVSKQVIENRIIDAALNYYNILRV
jgi:hypothetical protein